MNSKIWVRVAIAAIAILAANVVFTHVTDVRVETARIETRAAIARADSILEAKAASDAAVLRAVEEANASHQRSQRAEAHAVRANANYTRLRTQFAALKPQWSTPDSLVAIADSALAEADSTIGHLRTSLGEQIEATAKLQVALETEQAAHEKTANTLTELRTTSTSLVKATRPSLLGRILPKTGFGAAAGLDLTGRPNVVVGVTLSFR